MGIQFWYHWFSLGHTKTSQALNILKGVKHIPKKPHQKINARVRSLGWCCGMMFLSFLKVKASVSSFISFIYIVGWKIDSQMIASTIYLQIYSSWTLHNPPVVSIFENFLGWFSWPTFIQTGIISHKEVSGSMPEQKHWFSEVHFWHWVSKRHISYTYTYV